MAAIKATTKRAALIFIMSSPSQISVGHLKNGADTTTPLSTRIQKLELALCKKKTITWRKAIILYGQQSG
jgi:hypothetical protein